jgi:hypothetical protein
MRTLIALHGAILCAATCCAQTQVVATGLEQPNKLLVTPRGQLLVSETSLLPNAGRISVVSPGGARRSLIEGLPSGTDVAGSGSGPTAMATRARRLYVAIGGGDAERRGTAPGTSMLNPQGISSPLFSSVLEFRFSTAVDNAAGTLRLTPEIQAQLADGAEVQLDDGAGGSATASVLAQFPMVLPDPRSIYRFGNPWGLELSPDERDLWLVDASTNSLIHIDAGNGRWRRVLRFPPLANAGPAGPPLVDVVPTSVRAYDGQLLVSFLTGFPFTPGAARVLLVTPERPSAEPFILGLTSAVDVLWRDRQQGRRQFFVLEFSQNQSATPASPGRLLRFDSPQPQAMVNDLRAPVSMQFDPASDAIYVVELSGRLLRIPIEP